MTGREFQSLGNLKKYELRVVTLLEYLWWSLIPDDLVAEVRKDVSSGSDYSESDDEMECGK